MEPGGGRWLQPASGRADLLTASTLIQSGATFGNTDIFGGSWPTPTTLARNYPREAPGRCSPRSCKRTVTTDPARCRRIHGPVLWLAARSASHCGSDESVPGRHLDSVPPLHERPLLTGDSLGSLVIPPAITRQVRNVLAGRPRQREHPEPAWMAPAGRMHFDS
jgi:hypothetical protein